MIAPSLLPTLVALSPRSSVDAVHVHDSRSRTVRCIYSNFRCIHGGLQKYICVGGLAEMPGLHACWPVLCCAPGCAHDQHAASTYGVVGGCASGLAPAAGYFSVRLLRVAEFPPRGKLAGARDCQFIAFDTRGLFSIAWEFLRVAPCARYMYILDAEPSPRHVCNCYRHGPPRLGCCNRKRAGRFFGLLPSMAHR